MTDPTPPTWCCMTRPTGEDEMSNETEWVLVPKDAIERAIETLENDGDEHGEGRNLRAMLDAAPQPPAEAQPVAWQFQDREGKWHGFTDERHRQNTIADGSWPVRALYAAPPSAPVGVERLVSNAIAYGKRLQWPAVMATLERLRGTLALAQQPAPVAPVGVEGLPEKWRREAPRARVDVGEDASLAWREAVYWCAFQLEAALAQQPAAVDEAMAERITEAVVGWGTLPGDSPAEPEQVAELREVISAALAGQQQGGPQE